MKTFNIIAKATLASALIASTACSDFLDETNYHSQSAEDYYKTAVGYESLVNGAYSTLKSVYNTTNYYSLTQLGTDMSTQGNGNATNALNQYTVDYMADNGTVYSQWTALYTALKNVNAAINRAEFVTTKSQDLLNGMDETKLEQRVAEAKFIRALYLFEIVKNWHQAPLITEEPTSASTTSQLDSAEDFYTQILADLNDVIGSKLPWKQTSADYGRVSKAAAKHLKALVLLTRGYESFGTADDFKNAYSLAVDVINNSGHRLLDDYAAVHRQSNEQNDEIIFPINFSSGNGANNNIWTEFYLFVYREGWEDLSFSGIYCCDWATVMPTKYTYLAFDWKKDHRTEVTFMSPYNGDPATSVDGREYGQNWFVSTEGIKVPKGEPVILFPEPIESNYKQYTDAEKSASVADGLYIFNYPEGSYADCANDDYYKVGYQSYNAACRTWLPVWKFKDANTRYNSSGTVENGTRDIYLYRLAETYLIAAEAAVKAGDNANALKYINAVRNRASNYASESGLPEYTGTVTLDDILDERGLELFGEAPRWNDLQRTGKLAERVLKYNWDANNITGGLIKTQLSQSTFDSKYKYRPIPTSWLNTLSNGAELGNNPGW
ncbi:MAG: RagB/SusD family nutrient uptake outer membrane protein [Clostridium sp.]|nr:RagB/SusD family nutrient uptake outer membrane protein [Clostridium sp.]